MQYTIVTACDNCSQSHNAVIKECNNNKMTTENDSVRFSYEMYAKITYVKIRAYVSKYKIRTVRTDRTMT